MWYNQLVHFNSFESFKSLVEFWIKKQDAYSLKLLSVPYGEGNMVSELGDKNECLLLVVSLIRLNYNVTFQISPWKQFASMLQLIIA